MCAEFLCSQALFTNLKAAQQALDEWVDFYNTERPHQAMDMLTPAQVHGPPVHSGRSTARSTGTGGPGPADRRRTG